MRAAEDDRTMPKRSAGLLIYRRTGGALELLLVHPGGPFWARKDDGAWSIPKGEYGEAEDALAVARREFAEEVGEAPKARSSISARWCSPAAKSCAPSRSKAIST